MSHTCSCHHSHATSRPTDVLRQEHRVIERALDAAEQMLERNIIDRSFMTSFIDFVRNFADGCHHDKEERALFPLMERAGVPRDGGPIGVMLHEHDLGRQLVRTIAANLDRAVASDPEAVRAVRAAAGQYIQLLRLHIQKEDNILFVMADQILETVDQSELSDKFNHSACARDTTGRHDHYVALADKLYEQAFAAAAPPA